MLSTIQKREKLNIVSRVGEEGPGGAYHDYKIEANNSDDDRMDDVIITFQKGPRLDIYSQHGIIDTDLLEIVRDRLISFQAGPFASDHNQKALEHIEIALMYSNRRVEDRIERSVLGTYNK